MGNQCKQCDQDLQSQPLKTQQNHHLNEKLYSFGLENSFQFDCNSINAIPQFGQSALKLKVYLSPPKVVRQLSEESLKSLQELEDRKEILQVNKNEMRKTLKRIQSEEQITVRPSPIRKRNVSEQHKTKKSKQKKSSSNIDKNERLSQWDSRTINKQLKQAKQALIFNKTYQCLQFQILETYNGEKNSKLSTLSAQSINQKDQVNKTSQSTKSIQYQQQQVIQKISEQRNSHK